MAAEILVIDDEINMLRTLRSMLEMEGYAVTTAATASDGLQNLGDCDLVLLDVRLPDRDGLEVLEIGPGQGALTGCLKKR